jgi:hypothetical protein
MEVGSSTQLCLKRGLRTPAKTCVVCVISLTIMQVFSLHSCASKASLSRAPGNSKCGVSALYESVRAHRSDSMQTDMDGTSKI